MELIDNFNRNTWTNGDPNQQEGFASYRIASRSGQVKGTPGQWKYAVFNNDEGDLMQVVLNGGGKRDPLNGIGNADLKIDLDTRAIIGVMVEDECVLYNTS